MAEIKEKKGREEEAREGKEIQIIKSEEWKRCEGDAASWKMMGGR